MTSSPFWDSVIYTVPHLLAYTVGLAYLAGQQRFAPRGYSLAVTALLMLLLVDSIYLAIRLNIYWDTATVGKRVVFLYPMSLSLTAVHAFGWVALAVAVGQDRAPRKPDTASPRAPF